MNEALLFLLLLLNPAFTTSTRNDTCQIKFVSRQTPSSGLTFDASQVTYEIYHKVVNNNLFKFANISRDIITRRKEVVGVIITKTKEYNLALNISGRLKVFPNRTSETEGFWRSFSESKTGWTPLFMDCYFFRSQWFYGYVLKTSDISIGLFVRVILNPCDESLEGILPKHRCHNESTTCEPIPSEEEQEGEEGYRCICRPGYFNPQPTNQSWREFRNADVDREVADSIDPLRCIQQQSSLTCNVTNGPCLVSADVFLKTIIFSIHLGCMAITVILGILVFKHRKAKAISTGMWTILEIILLGACILYSTILVKFFEPSVIQCFLEPWAREMGFIICYGAIILKLYHHLIEFRTRKAHRWVVKDTDLLKYLLIMTFSVFAYMAAFTAFMLNFRQENYDLLVEETISESVSKYQTCKPLLWDFVTEAGELIILIFGIHLSYATRNARTQFHERNFLCAAISLELAVSTIFYVSRILILPGLHPDYILIVCCVRIQLSTTVTLLLVFLPKFWYQQKQVRSLGQEYSCRVDAFKDINAHGPLTSHNSDVEVGEITLADMSPDDIRAELKRLYLQLEIFKSKTICRDNPHISKRRGGRKAAHRRFSLQKKGSREKAAQRSETSSSSSTRTKRWSSVKTVKQRSTESQVFSLTVSGHETLCSKSSVC
ncbi:probable G-protein coupled receptor 158 isoform X2 [Coccinella septempunctata]|uniref:probable G-protein coupled receptor 158 isoform X2 n=1 Tax=Coccinella septempunctata TaxID=41139 RepID=UPI001D0674E9|nr:probable G-protein coupled receptor 158 isoform X2 [Coccinella septempunctata]